MMPDLADPNRTNAFLATVVGNERGWEPWALLRAAEARAPGLPRIGRSRLPGEDVVEITQAPALGFVPSSIAAVEPTRHGGRYRIIGNWFGLLGSMGPLPLHLSEYAVQEGQGHRPRPFGRFLDLVARRMQQMLFRAFGDGHAAVQADRPDDDRFAGYVAALTGATEGAGVEAGNAFPAHRRLAYASLFASRRSAVAIEDALAHLLGSRVTLLEYQPRHHELACEDRTRLAQHFTQLGGEAVLGHRVRTVGDAYRVLIRAGDMGAYRALLPGGPRHALAAAALNAWTPGRLDWDMALEIASDAAKPARLDGHAALGWTSWIGPAASACHRRDAHLRRTSGKGRKVE